MLFPSILTGHFKFYNGKLKGKTSTVNGTIEELRTGATCIDSEEDGYKVKYFEDIENYSISDESGTKLYKDLAMASLFAKDGQIITALDSITDTSTPYIYGNIILDTNQKTITTSKTITINDGATLTIEGEGTISSSSDINVITNSGTLNIGNVTIESTTASTSYGAIENSSGILNMNSGTITGVQRAINNSKGTININNGTVTGVNRGISTSTNAISNININDGIVQATAETNSYGIYNYATSTEYAKKTIVNGGTVKGGTYGIYNYGNYVVTVIKGKTGKITSDNTTISGGTYGINITGRAYFLGGILKGTTAGYNGTFTSTGNGTIGDDNEDGYEISYIEEGDNENQEKNYRVTLGEDIYYASTLQEAFDLSDNSITLLKDITDSSTVNIASNQTLNLQGYILTRTTIITVNSGCELSIVGEETGKIITTTGITNNGLLKLTGGTITSESYINVITNTGILTINGGIIESTANKQAYIENYRTYYRYFEPILNSGNGEVNINDGRISGKYYGIYNSSSNSNGKVNMSGGIIETTSKTDTGYGIYNFSTSSSYNPTVTVTGGTIKTNYGSGIFNSGQYATVTIGDKEAILNKNTPVIIGASYGLTNAYNGKWNFYNGILEGSTGGNSGTPTECREGCNIYVDEEIESGTVYKVTYLVGGGSYKIIEDETNTLYATLSAVVKAAHDGETITVTNNVGDIDDETIISKNIALNMGEYLIARTGKIIVNPNAEFTINGNETGGLSNASGVVIENNGKLTINSGMISGKTYGIQNGTETESSATTIVNGGQVIGSTYGIYNFNNSENSELSKYVYAYKGKVTGGTYGIYNYGKTSSSKHAYTYIGKSTDELDKENLVISGKQYGVYNTNGSWEFYNGKIMGIDSAYYYWGTPSAKRTDYNEMTGGETINETRFKTAYFGLGNYTITTDGNKDGFMTLVSAYEAAEDGQTIYLEDDLWSDNEQVTIKDKNIILNLQNATATRSQSISVQSGYSLTITGEEKGCIDFTSSGITNWGEINMQSSTVKCVYTPIYNYGTLNVNGGLVQSTSSSTAYAVSNYNIVNMTNGTLSGAMYGIYQSDSKGVLNMSGGTIEITGTTGNRYGIYNSSTNSNSNPTVIITGGIVKTANGMGGSAYGIYNSGELATVTIGSKENELNKTNPVISGGEYGIFNANNGKWHFYNGILKGTLSGYHGNESSVREGYSFVETSIIDDDILLQLAYLGLPLLSNSNGVVGTDNSIEVPINYDDINTLNATSDNTDIAQASIEGSILKITGISEGTTTINLTSSGESIEQYDNKTYTISVYNGPYVVGTTSKDTLLDAYNALSSESIIYLVKDVSDTSSVTINKKSVAIIMPSEVTSTRTSAITVSSGYALTIDGKGTIDNTNGYGITISSGTVNIEGGTISGKDGISNSGTLNVANGTIKGNTETGIYSTGTLNLENGTVYANQYGIRMYGTFNMYSGTIQTPSNSDAIAIWIGNLASRTATATAKIYGGNIISPNCHDGIYVTRSDLNRQLYISMILI